MVIGGRIESLSLSSLKSRLDEVIVAIRNVLGDVHLGKVQKVANHLGTLVEYQETAGAKKCAMLEKVLSLNNDIWLAATEAHRITFTFRWLKKDYLNSDYFKCAISGIFPPIVDDRVIVQDKPYNREFQYYTAAILQQSSIDVIEIEKEKQEDIDNDVAGISGSKIVIVECKRVYSDKKLEASATKAAQQLYTTFGGNYRIIVMDISPLMYEKCLRTEDWSEEEVQKHIQSKAPAFADRIQKVVTSPSIHFVILETLVPFSQKKYAPCSCKYRYLVPIHADGLNDKIIEQVLSCKE